MLQHKNIKNISELKISFTPQWVNPDFIYRQFNAISFSRIGKAFNAIKVKGYSFESVFTILVTMLLIGETTVSALTCSIWQQSIQARKDVFYRLKNNPLICWRQILWAFALKYKKISDKASGFNESLKCLVFDDTDLPKTGKRIEFIGRIWNHVFNVSILGFKMLVMGYWDGTCFIPVDFSLHREKGQNKEKPYGMGRKEIKRQYHKKRDKSSYGQQRVNELDENKIERAIKMFWGAIYRGFKPDYVLLDSWFTCEAFVLAVKKVTKHTVHLIGMYKIAKQKFLYNGNMLTYSQINNMLGTPKRCRKARLYYKQAQVTLNGTPVVLYFSRNGKNGKWKVFLTTDVNLTFMKMVEIYQIRWTIEVFFRECKQLLGLGKCQSNDFDAQIAETTITLIQHILLTIRHRFDQYESKIGLFKQMQQEVQAVRLNERLWGLFLEILNIIEDIFEIDALELIERIMKDEKACQKINTLFGVESFKPLPISA
jgi:predicted nucleic acid-binding Zn finger protein